MDGPLLARAEESVAPGLFTMRAADMPDALAVADGPRELSYRELEVQSNRLAHHLLSLGVTPGAVVTLFLDCSFANVVGALGILKAGAVYLPLDSSIPPERLRFILCDAGISAVITERKFASRFSRRGWNVVALDDEATALARYSLKPPPIEIRPASPAYVIYTSGSTGQPKGVQVSHASLLNLIRWHQRAFNITPRDRASLLANPAFDAAVWELWPYLTAGASVHVVDEDTKVSPERLRDWIVDQRITIGFAPTVLAERLIQLEWPPHTALRTLLTGADLLQHYPPAGLPFTLVNNYGPTECTVVATSGAVLPNEPFAPRPPIGRPIDNVQVYVLDEELRLVPPEAAGELYIGGAGLANGYINHPELTAEKFIPNPLSNGLPGLLYCTGDRARFLSDGQLEFLGRTDDQVKIRGHRIELNDVSCALARNLSVQSSVVVARENGDADKQLVAYVVPDDGKELNKNDLREHLLAFLPEYMVPATFVSLPSLPLTPNGKINRSALPEPNDSNTIRGETFEPPHTPTEKKLAELLSTMLEAERVGASDNFFLLGGHSLLGAQLIARIRDSFGAQLSLRTLFDHPTVSGIASEIDRAVAA